MYVDHSSLPLYVIERCMPCIEPHNMQGSSLPAESFWEQQGLYSVLSYMIKCAEGTINATNSAPHDSGSSSRSYSSSMAASAGSHGDDAAAARGGGGAGGSTQQGHQPVPASGLRPLQLFDWQVSWYGRIPLPQVTQGPPASYALLVLTNAGLQSATSTCCRGRLSGWQCALAFRLACLLAGALKTIMHMPAFSPHAPPPLPYAIIRFRFGRPTRRW
jgi:hypothetical protein